MSSQNIATDRFLEQRNQNLDLYQKEKTKQELRRRIRELLQIARMLPFEAGLAEIRNRLFNIQQYAQFMGKGFIFVEQEITCDQYSLEGCHQDAAVLFRGPREDASVAICLTHKGSLLYRNSCSWIIYRDAGDIGCACGASCACDVDCACDANVDELTNY